MKVDMTEDWQGLTVNTECFVCQSGSVFYAFLPCLPSSAETLKHCLVSTLWEHLVAIESPVWKSFQSSNRSAFPIQVVRGLLGRPRLLLGEYQGPSISFSEGGGKMWAALCGDESDIGIDVAAPNEFPNEYPFDRVFHPQELQHALTMADGKLESAAALLWSIKEAAVKALGCAFHLVDPLQITVYPSQERAGEVGAGGNEGYPFSVGLSGKALERFPLAAGSLSIRSFPQRKAWLSIALLNQRSAGHE